MFSAEQSMQHLYRSSASLDTDGKSGFVTFILLFVVSSEFSHIVFLIKRGRGSATTYWILK